MLKTHCVRGHAFSSDNIRIDKVRGTRLCKKCCAIRITEWRHNHPDIKPEYKYLRRRKQMLRQSYGLTLDSFAALIKVQDNKCLICCNEFGSTKGTGPHTDHNHQTGRVRGLLCIKCNTMMGYVDRDPSILKRLADYKNKDVLITKETNATNTTNN